MQLLALIAYNKVFECFVYLERIFEGIREKQEKSKFVNKLVVKSLNNYFLN